MREVIKKSDTGDTITIKAEDFLKKGIWHQKFNEYCFFDLTLLTVIFGFMLEYTSFQFSGLDYSITQRLEFPYQASDKGNKYFHSLCASWFKRSQKCEGYLVITCETIS